jgi:hypothetical protein
MDRELVELIWHRVHKACEYCQLPQAYDALVFEIDHVIATIHGGKTTSGNLALSCFLCNRHKGPNLTGIDPHARKVTRLFNPRRHSWHRHFEWNGPSLVGRTAIGRTTIRVLQINHYLRISHRRELIAELIFPPRQQ